MEATKLKNSQVVRIFISSPFNGMEKERDILTKFHWPKIESALSAKGLHLKVVDMRWGITHSSSNDSQTINICMREIDRSDIFVGLFGQRYGWSGRNDSALQDNFDIAAEKYPWVDHYRDRSVTELEFFHGHLNKPGEIPACFCFRDKSYDDKMRKEGELEGNSRKLKSFSVEDDKSMKSLDDLKRRVAETESKTLGVNVDYCDPQNAADYIYAQVWKYVENEILAKIDKPVSEKDKVTLSHKAYLTSNCDFYVGAQRYFDELDKYINDSEGEYSPLVLEGPSGSGKTALLCNWLDSKIKTPSSSEIIHYHFVGAEGKSGISKYIMTRLIDTIQQTLTGTEYPYENTFKITKITDTMSNLLKTLSKDEHKDKKVIIVVDNVDKILRKKTSKPMFWLPKSLPINVKVILSVTSDGAGADEVLEILKDEHKAKILMTDPISQENKKELVKKLLEDNSKSMDHEQLQMIIDSPKTTHPLFLKVLINELCVAGRFRKLNEQINNLLQSNGVHGLLVNVFNRIKEDYVFAEYNGDAVEEILCALYLCKQGMEESDFPMPQHIWAPVVYAIESFLIDRGNMLSFASPEMSEAVKAVCMPTDEKLRDMAKKTAEIFSSKYKDILKDNNKFPARIATELLHLLRLSEDRSLLMNVLGDIQIFESVYNADQFQLNDYWQWLETPSLSICNRYLRSLDCYATGMYSDHVEHYETDRLPYIMKRKSVLVTNLREWFEDSKLFHGMERILDREIEIDKNRQDLPLIKRKEFNCYSRYRKACFLSDTERYKEALDLHNEVLEERNELIAANIMDKQDLGMSYHGIGLCHYNTKNLDEAALWYKKSLEAQASPDMKSQQSATHCNLGLIYMSKGKLDMALEAFNKSNALKEEVEPSRLSLEIAYNYHNMGLAYRKKKDFDSAEKFYLKSVKIKENLLGRNSFDVALSIMNIGTLNTHRKNHEKALVYAEEALTIFKVLAPEGSYRTMMAQENYVNQLTMLDRYEEAVPFFKEVCAYLKTKPEGSANGLPPLHRRFIKWFMKEDRYEEAADIAYELVKCSKAKPKDYALLAAADSGISVDKRVKRQENVTLDYGLSKYPMDTDILMAKFEQVINNSPSELMSFIKTHCQNASTLVAIVRRYIVVAETLKTENEEPEKAIQVLEMAIEDLPDRKDLVEKLKSFQKEINDTK